MRAVTSFEMKNIERIAIDDIGIPSLVLMENAAENTVCEIEKHIINLSQKPYVVIFAGKGNNGGDGIAVYRKLLNKKIGCDLFFLGEEEKASNECKKQIDILNKLDLKINYLKNENDLIICAKKVEKSNITVDALIGTGLKSELNDFTASITNIINENSKYVIAVDCPTGLNSDNGKAMKNAVRANKTVTFHMPKRGLFLNDASEYAGCVSVKDISIPYSIKGENISDCFLFDSDLFEKVKPKRKQNSHKNTFGKVVIIAGSKNMPGALVISSLSAYKTGCGLVEACTVPKACEVLNNIVPEAITKKIKEKDGMICIDSIEEIEESVRNADSVIIGPGIGRSANVTSAVRKILSIVKCPLIIDADGLNAVSEDLNMLKTISTECVITPHIGEMSRLTGIDKDDIKNNMIDIAFEFSKKYNLITHLKSSRSVTVSPKGNIFINTTGNSAAAKGGSGDCLTGIIASLAAQGTDVFYSAAMGAYIFGEAVQKVSEQLGQYSVTAMDIANGVSFVMRDKH